MPLLEILSEKQIREYEEPPVFSAVERKHFLTMPLSVRNQVDALSTPTNKVGFQLMFGYFLARKRFYFKEQFRNKDIHFLCRRLGIMDFGFDKSQYRQTTYTRHRTMILEYFAFQIYQPSIHNTMLSDAIKTQVYSWEDNIRIFKFLLQWLEFRNIELPTYHNLQSIITQSIRDRNKAIRQQFNELLQEHHRTALDKLMEKHTQNQREEYVLTLLQNLSPSDSPKQIRANMDKFQQIQTLFEVIHPLMQQMNFSDQAIQYFGEFVTASLAANLNRRTDKYLYLACFSLYQRAIFEDWMTLTFLNVCKLAINRASRKEKERLFEYRKQHEQRNSQIKEVAQDYQELIKQLQQIAWADIPSIEKEKQFQQFLPLPQSDESSFDDLQQIKEQFQYLDQDDYYGFLARESQSLQQRANPILKKLTFNPLNSNKKLMVAIQHFKDKEGAVTKNAPVNFLSEEDKAALVDEKDKFQVSLYKVLLFQTTTDAIKRGSLNLQYSFNYKAMDDYLLPKHLWEKDMDGFLDRANLGHLKDFQKRKNDFKKMVSFHLEQTNERILKGENGHFRKRKNNKYYVVTPKVEKEELDLSIFPSEASISISEVLATIDAATNFLEEFRHLQPTYRRKRPNKSVFFAGITAYGCNLGIPAMAQAASQVQAKHLENTVNWYFSVENINRANDVISKFTDSIPLANLYRKNQDELRTSSDGQKIKTISEDTIFASYSTKYFDKRKGVVAYSFVDERCIPYYSDIIDPFLREAPFVIDGLLHNDVIKSTVHVTDTHGYTEAVFGLLDLLGFGFSPNIAKMLDQHIYTFKDHPIAQYKQKGYLVLPKGYFKEEQIEESWNEMLRLVVSLKLKYCKASQVFSRFNTFSKQHPLYAALKQYGRMPKTVHILRSTDDVKMRQDGRKSGNAIESSNRFSSAVFFANGGEIIFLERKQQRIAEACKTLIKNAIICWNYLYLTRKVQRVKNPQQATELVNLLKTKTANAWRHIHFTGTYDFSDKNLADSFNLLDSQNYDLNID